MSYSEHIDRETDVFFRTYLRAPDIALGDVVRLDTSTYKGFVYIMDIKHRPDLGCHLYWGHPLHIPRAEPTVVGETKKV